MELFVAYDFRDLDFRPESPGDIAVNPGIQIFQVNGVIAVKMSVL